MDIIVSLLLGDTTEVVNLLICPDNYLLANKKKAAIKLHHQFGHARIEKIIQLIKDAGLVDKDLFVEVNKAEENCVTCQRFKKPKSRPVVGFSLAKDFNEVVSMDIKYYKGSPILHLIDHYTRFSAAVAVGTKKKESIIEGIFKHWVAIFGCPRRILTDNGGEFNNDMMRELGDLLNTQILATAAEAPWQNGMTKRHNGILANMINKIIEDTRCSLTTALAWAVSAKNSLSNVYGFSPNQLVFGRNPNFPSILHDDLPALGTKTSSELVAEHLNALHSARKSFIESEASAKLRQALLRKTRTATVLGYENGDRVFYKRQNSDRWRGPATVIGVEGKQIFVKHGGVYLRLILVILDMLLIKVFCSMIVQR